MKIIIAPDSFKGSLTAMQACRAIAEGIRRVNKTARLVAIPMADGGEGTTQAMVSATGGKLQEVEVTGPLGGKVKGFYGILGEKHRETPQDNPSTKTAVIEMAAAAGLPLVPEDKRNPLYTTTYGFGQLIRAAIKNHCTTIIAGMGGSATGDCGTGMAQALGVKFYDRTGRLIKKPMTAQLMGQVGDIDLGDTNQLFTGIKIVVACDVISPLLGKQGAARVYGPQKCAKTLKEYQKQAIIEQMEASTAHIIDIIEAKTGKKIRHIPGTGAAGGLAAGLLAFTPAQLDKGVDIIIGYNNLAQEMIQADMVMTGEGRVDASTAAGKTIAGIAKLAQQNGNNVPVIAFAGSIGPKIKDILPPAVKVVIPICPGPLTLKQALNEAETLLADAAERTMKIINLFAKQ